jgi:hypothetical protein
VTSVFYELVSGKATRDLIYASMYVARKRKYFEREQMFKEALSRFDEFKKDSKE